MTPPAKFALATGAIVLSLVGTGMAGGYLLGRRTAPRPSEQAQAGSSTAPETPPAGEAQAPAPIGRREMPVEAVAEQARPAETPAAAEGSAEPPSVTPEQERDRGVERLRASGPDRKNLLERARAVGDAMTAVARAQKIEARFGAWECHSGGCFVTAVQESETAIEDLTTDISRAEEFRGWDGPKMRSGPIPRANGSVEVTWMLFSDDRSATVATGPQPRPNEQ